MATQKFSSELDNRGTLKVTDKLIIQNIDTGAVEYTTVAELMTSLSSFAAGQIGFPATQKPSSNVNTLDDYQEGEFTPVLQFGGASSGITYSIQNGYYTKIGNLLNFTMDMLITSKGASTGSVAVSGLPFEESVTAACSLWLNDISFEDFPMGLVSDSTILLKEITNAGIRTDLNDTNFENNSRLNINGTYRV
jgi:hypothetical protein